MLVLTRKENEKICIGDNIVITIVRTSGDKVRLGIEAPSDVVVLRSELKAKESTKETTKESSRDSLTAATTIPFSVPRVKCS